MPELSRRRQVIAIRLAIIAVAFVSGANLLRPSCITTVAAEQPLQTGDVREQFIGAPPTPAPRWTVVTVAPIHVRVLQHPSQTELRVRIAQRIAQRLASRAAAATGG